MTRGLMQKVRDFLLLDGIPDEDLSPGSDWKWLSPDERLSVQSRADAEVAQLLIERRKRAEQEARDALFDYINAHGTEDVQEYLDRYVRAARVRVR